MLFILSLIAKAIYYILKIAVQICINIHLFNYSFISLIPLAFQWNSNEENSCVLQNTITKHYHLVLNNIKVSCKISITKFKWDTCIKKKLF